MEHVIIAQKREAKNKKLTKQIRINGGIPAVIYGNGKEPISISLNQRDFRKQFLHISESTLITLKIEGGDTRKVLIKDYVENLIRNSIEHIDFFEISEGKALHTKVLINIHGTPEGAKKSGVTEHLLHEVEVECLPKDLPEHIDIDITPLDVGMALYVKDLPSLPGVTYRSSEEQVVVQISASRQASLVPDVEDVFEEDEEGAGAEQTADE